MRNRNDGGCGNSHSQAAHEAVGSRAGWSGHSTQEIPVMQKAIGVFAATALVTALFVGKSLAIPPTPGNSGGQVGVDPQNHFHLAQQCWQRVGPFATQTTAWQRWREAQARGYAVSNGVVPCYDQGTRGYCFNVFYSC
jgi:hypothetical protein